MPSTLSKCKLCRRAGEKLFLKGERCGSAKCSFSKKPYAPGQHSKKGGPLNEYGKQLLQKQTLKRTYGVREKQFSNYFQKASGKKGRLSDALMESLEMRLDNVIFRLGFADSRSQARQLVSHGFFVVSGKSVNIPSFEVRIGDQISFKQNKAGKKYLEILKDGIGKKQKGVPAWLEMDPKEFQGKVMAVPTEKDIRVSADLQAIIEFYSR